MNIFVNILYVFVFSVYVLVMIGAITKVIIETRIETLNRSALQNYKEFQEIMIQINNQILIFNKNFEKSKKIFKEIEEENRRGEQNKS